MKKILLPGAIILLFAAGVGLGWYIRNQTLNPRAVIPHSLEKIAGYAILKGEKEDDDLLYYDTSFASFIANGSTKTKAAVEGVVDKIEPQPDGDYHIIMRPQSNPAGPYLVTEAIPKIKLPLPKEGDSIKIWGIVRFDVLHNWWELHPVIGWEKLK